MRAIRYSFLFPLAFAIASFYAIRVDAQVGTGTISGVVMDPSGAVVVGALVSITNSQTGVVTSATTNSEGRYVVPDLIVGTYDVQAAKQGFETQVIKQVLLTVGANVVVDCKLAVGQKITAINCDRVQAKWTLLRLRFRLSSAVNRWRIFRSMAATSSNSFSLHLVCRRSLAECRIRFTAERHPTRFLDLGRKVRNCYWTARPYKGSGIMAPATASSGLLSA